MIPAKAQYDRDIKLTEKKLRVAAYCRVSTELEQQESSSGRGRSTMRTSQCAVAIQYKPAYQQ